MKLYAVQYRNDIGAARTIWASTIAEADTAYADVAEHDPVIRIIALPSGRDAMAVWLNTRGVPVGVPAEGEPNDAA